MAGLTREPGMNHGSNPYVEAALDLVSRPDTHVDPDLVWGFLTGFRYFRRPHRWVSVIIECAPSVSRLRWQTRKRGWGGWFDIPRVYRKWQAGPDAHRLCHCTARIELELGKPYPWLRLMQLFEL